jgi:hypothetical protein
MRGHYDWYQSRPVACSKMKIKGYQLYENCAYRHYIVDVFPLIKRQICVSIGELLAGNMI